MQGKREDRTKGPEMRVLMGSEGYSAGDRGCVLTIGNFDGLHRGHRVVIESAVERARDLDVPCVVYTFDPHPSRVLHPERAQPLLMTARQMELALESLGVGLLVREPFTPEFSSLTPDAFLRDVLDARIGPRELIVGRDFHFGKGRGGSGGTLVQLAPTLGIRVVIVPEVHAAGQDVSSTRIRKLLAEGEVEEAHQCLGRPYSVWGRVIEGDRRGREIGFPTANLELENELSPARGVYASWVRRIGTEARPVGPSRPAVTNVGTRPTFEKRDLLTETHLIDFEGDLYGDRIEVAYVRRIRSEQRFPGIEALRHQIQIDVEQGRRILAGLDR